MITFDLEDPTARAAHKAFRRANRAEAIAMLAAALAGAAFLFSLIHP